MSPGVCLMRRYTEAAAGAGTRWIELDAARTREHIAAPAAPGPWKTPEPPCRFCVSWHAAKRLRPSSRAAATERGLPSQQPSQRS